LLGLGNRSLFMYRLGRADMGVSILFLLSLYASRFWLVVGGGGRANGFGGPLAPADITADALGDGGGRTIWSPLLVGFADGSVDCAGEPLAESLSSASEGICKFNLGRAPDLDPDVSERCGGANSGTAVCGLTGRLVARGTAGAVVLRGIFIS
jgi:hypothetical protein